MPSGDRKGPLGFGPMTGRGAGYCAGHGVPGYMNPAGGSYRGREGFGYGRGGGCGRGYRNMYHATGLPGWTGYGNFPAPYAPADSKAAREAEEGYLRSQAELLKGNLNSLEKRLEELETEKDADKETE